MAREIQSSIIEKSVAVVDLLAKASGKLSFSEIVSETQFNKSSTHRILSILVGQGLASFDERDKSYTVGPKLVTWARAAWQKTDLSLVEDQDLKDLSEATGMNVAVSVLIDHTITFIRTCIPQPYKLAVKIGGESELHCTAAGKVFLAHMSKERLDDFFKVAELEKYTEATLTTRKEIVSDLKQVRALGYAVSHREEFWQISGVAAPIKSYDNQVLAALSLWTPARFGTFEQLLSNADLVRETAEKISSRFGSMANVN